MEKSVFRLFVLSLVLAFGLGAGIVLAQASQRTNGGAVTNVFTLTTSTSATYSNPSGALEPMPFTSLDLTVSAQSLLTISFSARGTVEPSGSEIIPIVFVGCLIDGQACQPDSNTVEFLYPQFCCDTRAFHWVANSVAPGTHTVKIIWGMGNPTLASVTNRSLIVEAATLAATGAN
jgi:hypothetical protein